MSNNGNDGRGKMANFDGLCIVRLGFKQGDPLFTYRRFIAASVVVLSKLFVLSKSDPLTTKKNYLLRLSQPCTAHILVKCL